MQNKPNDSMKIFALVGAIVLVVVFVAVQIYRTTQTATAATTTGSPEPTGQSPALQSASAFSSSEPQDTREGQMRQFDTTLDADPPPGQFPTTGSGNPGAFRSMKITPVSTAPPTLPLKRGPEVLPTTDRGRFDSASPAVPGTQPGIRPTVPVVPPEDWKLEGVVIGPDGFAQLTMRPSGQSGGELTVYKRTGDHIRAFRIGKLNDNGLVLEGKQGRFPWIVGSTLQIGQTITPVNPTPGAAGSPGSATPGAAAAEKSPLPERPPTQTPTQISPGAPRK